MQITTWHNCYPSRWQGLIAPEAMAHPAKYSSRLIAKIYRHILEEGWVKPGDTIIDPFGGVSLGALDAMRLGLNWTGIELEPHFVKSGNANIDLWNTRYAGKLPNWGSARLLNGDSRNLMQVIGRADASVSSPPYSSTGLGKASTYTDQQKLQDEIERARKVGGVGTLYGTTPGQLGSLPPGDYRAAISSPPFLQSQGGTNVNYTEGPLSDPCLIRRHSAGNQSANAYGESDGQLSSEQPDTFWTASRLIVNQVYQVLAPGAHAVWVVKGFVKNKEIVDFPGQWRELCESAGFLTLHEHRAMLVHHRATYQTIDGDLVEDKVESKSFFRRMLEKKGSPRIDWETVYCMEKPRSTNTR